MLKFKKIFSWILLLLAMALIFYFSSQDADLSTEVSNSFTKSIVNFLTLHKLSNSTLGNIAISVDTAVRKAAHFTIYAILGLLCFNALFNTFRKTDKKYWIIAIIICALYAISDEVHQLFVPGRAGMVKDVIIDTCGSVSGSYICRKFYIKRSVRR